MMTCPARLHRLHDLHSTRAPHVYHCSRSGARADGQADGRNWGGWPDGQAVGRSVGRPNDRWGGRSGGHWGDGLADRRSNGGRVRPSGCAAGGRAVVARSDGRTVGRSGGRSDGRVVWRALWRRSNGQGVGGSDGRAVRRTVGRSGDRANGRSGGRSRGSGGRAAVPEVGRSRSRGFGRSGGSGDSAGRSGGRPGSVGAGGRANIRGARRAVRAAGAGMRAIKWSGNPSDGRAVGRPGDRANGWSGGRPDGLGVGVSGGSGDSGGWSPGRGVKRFGRSGLSGTWSRGSGGRSQGRAVVRSVARSVGRAPGRAIGRMVGRPGRWSDGRGVGRFGQSSGQLVGRSGSREVVRNGRWGTRSFGCRPVGRPVNRSDLSLGWSVGHWGIRGGGQTGAQRPRPPQYKRDAEHGAEAKAPTATMGVASELPRLFRTRACRTFVSGLRAGVRPCVAGHVHEGNAHDRFLTHRCFARTGARCAPFHRNRSSSNYLQSRAAMFPRKACVLPVRKLTRGRVGGPAGPAKFCSRTHSRGARRRVENCKL